MNINGYNLPFINLIPRLDEQQYSELKADIEKRGVIVPIIVDENCNIIDGNHRLMIANELGILNTLKFDIRPKLSEKDKKYLAYDLNLHRRHLTTEQRQVLSVEMRKDGLTLEEIGSKLGVTAPTVMSDIDESDSPFKNLKADLPQKIKGKDGKTYPAKYKPRKKKTFEHSQTSIFAVGTKAAEKVASTLQALDTDRLPETTMTQRRFERVAREQQAQERRESVEQELVPILPSHIDIRPGDFKQVLANLPDNSIDLIFTDPPYLAEYLPEWDALAELAARVLKPGCLLVAYSGSYHLLSVMQLLAAHLNYVWLGSLKMHGPKSVIQQRHIYARQKPLLFFSKGEYQPVEFFDDFFEDDKPEKDSHDWQQGIAPALYYIEKLTKPGATILDPFLGSGTTAEAALKLNRNVIGADKDAAAYKSTLERIAR